MSITNPFVDNAPTDREDRALVARACAGDREALEDLVRRHQGWIYNIALRMLYHPQDAEDATQEILIKAVTQLSSFEGRSSFRTWLYRIVVNHVLNMRRGRIEHEILGFPAYGEALDATPDLELPDPSTTPVEVRLLVTEVMISCVSGMLLCLDREQRLTYILGDIFGVRYVEAQTHVRITGCERGFAVSPVNQRDRFRPHAQPRCEELSQPRAGDDEPAAVAIECETTRSLSLLVREPRCQRANPFAPHVQPGRGNLDRVVCERRCRSARQRRNHATPG